MKNPRKLKMFTSLVLTTEGDCHMGQVNIHYHLPDSEAGGFHVFISNPVKGPQPTVLSHLMVAEISPDRVRWYRQTEGDIWEEFDPEFDAALAETSHRHAGLA